jgi:hypothetical protein
MILDRVSCALRYWTSRFSLVNYPLSNSTSSPSNRASLHRIEFLHPNRAHCRRIEVCVDRARALEKERKRGTGTGGSKATKRVEGNTPNRLLDRSGLGLPPAIRCPLLDRCPSRAELQPHFHGPRRHSSLSRSSSSSPAASSFFPLH